MTVSTSGLGHLVTTVGFDNKAGNLEAYHKVSKAFPSEKGCLGGLCRSEAVGYSPCALTLMAIWEPWATCPSTSPGSRCVAYVPANAASESELPGEMAASRPAVLTCTDYWKGTLQALKP